MEINKIDVLWNYLATFLKIASSILLIPFVLKELPSEEVGLWLIFSTISGLIYLLDLGFTNSFSRNVSYVFSGIRVLQRDGVSPQSASSPNIDYGLLSGLIDAMRWLYKRLAIILFVLLATGGTLYIYSVLKHYQGNRQMAYISWALFSLLNTYNLYTFYYESLLIGRGFIRQSKQITITGQLLYLVIAAIAISFGGGLLSIVAAQILSIVYIRIRSNSIFFDRELLKFLGSAEKHDALAILKVISPNALKYGVTSLGGFLIQKSAVLMGSLYLSLSMVASFGIAKQIIDIGSSLATIFVMTYVPKIAHLRVKGNNSEIQNLYIKSTIIGSVSMLTCGSALVLFGNPILQTLQSKTLLPSQDVLILLAIGAMIAINCNISATVITTKNEVPFLKASLYSGLGNIILLFVFFEFTTFGIVGMALAPAIIDLCYQGWKWPLYVWREFDISLADFKRVLKAELSRYMNR